MGWSLSFEYVHSFKRMAELFVAGGLRDKERRKEADEWIDGWRGNETSKNIINDT